MTRTKQAGSPLFVVILIAGLAGYILGFTHHQREKSVQANGQDEISSTSETTTQQVSAAGAKGNSPLGRKSVAIMDGIRKTYDGPLALARDLMVINITKDNIEVRMAVVDEYVLPPDVTKGYKDADRTDKKETSAFITSGKWKGYTPPPMPKR